MYLASHPFSFLTPAALHVWLLTTSLVSSQPACLHPLQQGCPAFFFLKHTKHTSILGPLHEMLHSLQHFSAISFCGCLLITIQVSAEISLLTKFSLVTVAEGASPQCVHTYTQVIASSRVSPSLSPSKCLSLPGIGFVCLFVCMDCHYILIECKPENRNQVRFNHGVSPSWCLVIGPQ